MNKHVELNQSLEVITTQVTQAMIFLVCTCVGVTYPSGMVYVNMIGPRLDLFQALMFDLLGKVGFLLGWAVGSSSRWWFQTFLEFSPRKLGKMNPF